MYTNVGNKKPPRARARPRLPNNLQSCHVVALFGYIPACGARREFLPAASKLLSSMTSRPRSEGLVWMAVTPRRVVRLNVRTVGNFMLIGRSVFLADRHRIGYCCLIDRKRAAGRE
jgi:hypothetical protein